MTIPFPVRAQLARDSEDGFTVVELLVSFIIVAFLLTLLPASLRVNKRVWELEQATALEQTHNAFDRFVDDRLSTARNLLERTKGGNVQLLFEGHRDRIKFLSASRAGPNGGGLYNFEVFLDRQAGQDNNALSLRQKLYQPVAPSASVLSAAERKVPGNIAEIQFRYFGQLDAASEETWSDTWIEQTKLPKLVEIGVIGAPSERILARHRVIRLQFAAEY